MHYITTRGLMYSHYLQTFDFPWFVIFKLHGLERAMGAPQGLSDWLELREK